MNSITDTCEPQGNSARELGLANLLRGLAELLEYPGPHPKALIARVELHLERHFPQALPVFRRFAATFQDMEAEHREELFTATFDITPACVPYASIHLFGEENFKRGEFMAALSARYEQLGFNPGDELTDHIAVLLRFAAGVESSERAELFQFCILGPLGKMIVSLSADNPYRAALETLQCVGQTFAPVPFTPSTSTGNSARPLAPSACGACSAVHHDFTDSFTD